MPPLVWCAACSVTSGDSDRKEQSLRFLTVNKISTNPLLQRFLQHQQDLIAVPTLRQDLIPLRRAGHPTNLPIHSACIPQHVPWSSPVLSDRPSDCHAYAYAGMSSLSLVAEVPSLNFSDYTWASSAMQRTRIEAMYI